MTESPAVGVLMAGGSSSRMGGSKFAAPLGAATLAERTATTLARVTSTCVQSGGDPIPGLEWPRVPDLRPAGGPAAGIEAVLLRTAAPIVVLAVDLPFVPADLLRAALANVLGGATISAPRWNGRWQPLCAAYSAGALGPLRPRLDAGRNDLAGLLDEHATAIENAALEAFGDPGRLLMNVNTPDDLRRAEAMLRG